MMTLAKPLAVAVTTIAGLLIGLGLCIAKVTADAEQRAVEWESQW